MKEKDPERPTRPEEILGAFGVSSVRMDQIIVPGLDPALDVMVEKDAAGFIVFRSAKQHEPRPDNALFEGPVHPGNN